MTITELEAFNGLPTGTTIVCPDRPARAWDRREDGMWVAGDYVVDASYFVPYLREGVTVTSTYRVGQAWLDNGYVYYLLREGEGGAWHAARFNEMGAFVNLGPCSLGVDAVRTTPEWLDDNRPMLGALTDLTDISAQYLEQNADLRRRVSGPANEATRARNMIQEALHTYLEDHTGLTDTEREDLNEVLEECGLDRHRQREDVTVIVEVEGTSGATLATTDLERYVPAGCTASDTVAIEVEWTWSGDVEIEVEEGTCACEQVDRESVERLMEQAGIEWESFDYESSCSND